MSYPFASKPGCTLCGIVSTASHAPANSPLSPSFPAGSTHPEVLWRDDNFTAYREKTNPVSSKGHIIIAFNLHVPSIYTLSTSDLPLLVNIRNLATRLLTSLHGPSSPNVIATSVTPTSTSTPLQSVNTDFKIGFITPPFKDSKIPVTDHLHAHAYIGPADLLGWWRGVAYGSLAWYDVDDLIAEIRESSSNNRIKSGYDNRKGAPIDTVPHAGARMGTADGVEETEVGLTNPDIEEGGGLYPGSPSTIRPDNFPSSPPSGRQRERTRTSSSSRSRANSPSSTLLPLATLTSPTTSSDIPRTSSPTTWSPQNQIPDIPV